MAYGSSTFFCQVSIHIRYATLNIRKNCFYTYIFEGSLVHLWKSKTDYIHKTQTCQI